MTTKKTKPWAEMDMREKDIVLGFTLAETVEVHGYEATVYVNGNLGRIGNRKGGMPTPKDLREHAEFLLAVAHAMDKAIETWQEVGA